VWLHAFPLLFLRCKEHICLHIAQSSNLRQCKNKLQALTLNHLADKGIFLAPKLHALFVKEGMETLTWTR
jgi:hypothetical protein